jgi:hypothetical protein
MRVEYDHDVLIGYARDDDKPLGGKAAFGFMTTLNESIDTGPGVK